VSRTEHRDEFRRATLPIGLILALTAGTVDVCVALLTKPRGFEALTAVPPAILATALMVLFVYLVSWFALQPFLDKAGLDRHSFAVALGVWIGSAFTQAILVGLHTDSASPQTVFKAAIVAAGATLVAAGVYAVGVLLREKAALRESCRSFAIACPLLIFEVLIFEWLQVYIVDHLFSLLSAIVTAAAGVAMLATIALSSYARRRWAATGILVTFAMVLLAVPAAGTITGPRSGAVQAVGFAPGKVPRIILITVDTLRMDAVSAYRPEAPRTSAIDQLAGDGIVFEHARAPAPWTLPSVTSILTGLMPAAHQATGFTSSLSHNVTTLAEYLSDHGYYAAALVHNDLLNPKNGLSQGFAEYRTLDEQYFANSVGMIALQHAAPAWFPPPSWPTNEDQTRIAEQWLESNGDRNFFLWIHYLDPHAPYGPPRQYMIEQPLPAIGSVFEGQKFAAQGFFVPSLTERKAIRALYDGEVRYVDASIGRILSTLKRLRLYDDALIVFTSDHGEEFWEHGRIGHGHSLYEELLRVPLIVKLPGSTRRDRTSHPVSTASIAPTILDLSGIRYDAGNLSAKSLVPLIDPSTGPYEDAPLVSGAQIEFDRHDAVFFDGFKYIVSTIDGKEELFDLAADTQEAHSLAPSMPERLEIGRHLLQAEAGRSSALRKRIRVEEGTIAADEDTLRRLRSLGYVR
jgi:arylsulfatase A-like enzyme